MVTVQRNSRFNGAAPVRARKDDVAPKTILPFTALQRGRARAGAEGLRKCGRRKLLV